MDINLHLMVLDNSKQSQWAQAAQIDMINIIPNDL